MLKRVLIVVALIVAAWSWFDYRRTLASDGPGDGPRKRKIALVLSVGGLGDKSFNDSAYAGLLRGVEELGIEEAHGEPADIAEDAEFLDIYAQEGYDLIVGVGFLMQSSVEAAAKRHPDRNFAIIDAVVDAPNCASLVFSEHEGSFLVGALAMMASKTGKIGFVGGMDIPLIHKFEVGYVEGAKAIRADGEVMIKYAGAGPDAFHDPVKGKAIAESMFSQGADVVYHAAGSTGNGVIKAAEENRKLAIGVDSNQNYMAPGRVLTSMTKRVDVAVFKAIQELLDGAFKPGTHVFGLKEEGVGYAVDKYNRRLITPAMGERVERLRKEIIDGKLKVTNYFDTMPK